MRWESGEGLRGRALPDRGDAKLGMASTCNQLTKKILIPKTGKIRPAPEAMVFVSLESHQR